MSLESELNARLKAAMMARNNREADLIRQIKTEVTVRRTAPGFKGEVDDALHLEAIGAYIKRMTKALDAYGGTSEREVAMRAQLQWEIDYLKPFVPTLLDEPATRALVTETVQRLGISDRKQLGRLMGELMRAHRDKLDPALARSVAESILG